MARPQWCSAHPRDVANPGRSASLAAFVSRGAARPLHAPACEDARGRQLQAVLVLIPLAL
eukprot:15435513-Alexandrium_andersonii.AAC.2